MTFIQYLKKNYRTITLTAYLLPILFSVIVSLAHVVIFWDITNPMSWSIFLSIAIEVAVLSSIAASRMSNWAWVPFSLVTLVQIIGNVFFSYTNIDVTSKLFKDWVELFDPLFNFLGMDTNGDIMEHKRILATFSGAVIPMIAILFFHFFIRAVRMNPDDLLTGNISETETSLKNDVIAPQEQKKEEFKPELEPEVTVVQKEPNNIESETVEPKHENESIPVEKVEIIENIVEPEVVIEENNGGTEIIPTETEVPTIVSSVLDQKLKNEKLFEQTEVNVPHSTLINENVPVAAEEPPVEPKLSMKDKILSKMKIFKK